MHRHSHHSTTIHARRLGSMLSEVDSHTNGSSPCWEWSAFISTSAGLWRFVCQTVGKTQMAHAPKMTTCEVQSGTGWKIISISEALERAERSGRCVECNMPVRAHRKANNGMAAHFEHLARNASCSLSGGVGATRADRAPAIHN